MFDFLKRKKEPYVQSSTADWQDQWRSLVPPECRNVPVVVDGKSVEAYVLVNHFAMMLQDGLLMEASFFDVCEHFQRAGYHVIWLMRCTQDVYNGYLKRGGEKNGSTRFRDAFLEAQKRLTLAGNIVISVGLFGHAGDEEVWNEGVKEMLDDMHKRKIDMADEIFVVNVGGYIGESTRSEIDYATASGKPVRYLEPVG